jgi:hypothetical protein
VNSLRTGISSVALLAILLGSVNAASAATLINGEYQLQLDARKSQRSFPWDWDSNHNDNWTGAQLWLLTKPTDQIEGFIKFQADWKEPENNSSRPVFWYVQAHAQYEMRKGKNVFRAMLFSREDRFWVDNYLIRVVESGPLNNDRWGVNAQGIRIDAEGFLGLTANLIVSDFSDQFNPALPVGDVSRGSIENTDDAYIGRIRRQFANNNIRLGATYNRKEENQITEDAEMSEVVGFDSRLSLGWTNIGLLRNANVQAEFAWSNSPLSQNAALNVLFPENQTGYVQNNGVFVAEIRSLTLGSHQTGYLNFVPTYWNRGPLYDNRLGDANRDEIGYNLNFWYLIPARAITLTGNYQHFEKKVTELRTQDEIYLEAFIEFVNGFTGKVFYRKADIERDLGGELVLEEHDDMFFEVQVESRLAWLRLQTKLKDLGQPFQKELASMELRVNLTNNLAVYNRFVFGNDASRLRKAIFSQARWVPSNDMEIFLEYGPSWIGDANNPVDDGDLEGGGDQTDIIKFIIKGRF